MSKQDSKFFNIFSLVLGILIVITVVLFSLARSVGDNTQKTHLLSDPKYVAAVEGRIGKTEVAVVGQDNSALAIAPAAGVGPLVAAALPADGPAVYEAVCGACHMNGIAGAPAPTTRPLGPRASHRAPPRSTSTPSKATKARAATCRRRAVAWTSRTSSCRPPSTT